MDAICIVGLHEQETVEIWASLNSYLSVSSSWKRIHPLWIHRVKHAFKELSSSYSLWSNEKEGNGGGGCLFYIAFGAFIKQDSQIWFSLCLECFKLHWQVHLSFTCSLWASESSIPGCRVAQLEKEEWWGHGAPHNLVIRVFIDCVYSTKLSRARTYGLILALSHPYC